jgi:hypothetical protein
VNGREHTDWGCGPLLAVALGILILICGCVGISWTIQLTMFQTLIGYECSGSGINFKCEENSEESHDEGEEAEGEGEAVEASGSGA